MSKAKTVVNLIDELTETLKEKDEEIKELQERINKAIEYIYEISYDEDRKMYIDDLWEEIPVLMNILKGD